MTCHTVRGECRTYQPLCSGRSAAAMLSLVATCRCDRARGCAAGRAQPLRLVSSLARGCCSDITACSVLEEAHGYGEQKAAGAGGLVCIGLRAHAQVHALLGSHCAALTAPSCACVASCCPVFNGATRVCDTAVWPHMQRCCLVTGFWGPCLNGGCGLSYGLTWWLACAVPWAAPGAQTLRLAVSESRSLWLCTGGRAAVMHVSLLRVAAETRPLGRLHVRA